MRNQRGFTLIEVLVALVILTVVIMGVASATGQFVHVVATSDRQTAAIQLVEDRIELIQMDPNYAGLDTTYVATEGGFPTLPGFKRVTQITRVTGSGQDHKKVTVTVTGPGLTAPIKRTVTKAAP